MNATVRAAFDAHAVLVSTFDRIGATWDQSPIAGDSAPFMSTYAEASAHYPGTLPEHARTFDSIGTVKRYAESVGSHYWSRDAVRYFQGRTDSTLYGRRVWVESRRYVPGPYSHDTTVYPREYSVAWVESGPGASIGKLGSYPTLDAARRAARELAAAVDALDACHADYPHHPGSLYDCPACEVRCWCTGADGVTECVADRVHNGTREAREAYRAEVSA